MSCVTQSLRYKTGRRKVGRRGGGEVTSLGSIYHDTIVSGKIDLKINIVNGLVPTSKSHGNCRVTINRYTSNSMQYIKRMKNRELGGNSLGDFKA